MQRAPALGLAITGCLLVIFLVDAELRLAQAIEVPDLTATERQLREIGEILKTARADTERFLAMGREKVRGECEGLYPRIPEQRYLVPVEIIQRVETMTKSLSSLAQYIRPLVDLDSEVRGKRSELDSFNELIARARNGFQVDSVRYRAELQALTTVKQAEEKLLVDLRRDQMEAVREWLSKHGGASLAPTRIQSGNQVVIIAPVRLGRLLFGTFFAKHEHELRPKQQDRLTVTFAPTVLSDELYAGASLSIAPATYSVDVSQMFQPTIVEAAGRAEPFKLGQAVPASFKEPITWTWKAVAPDDFRGTVFDLLYEGRLREQGSLEKRGTVAKLAIDIRRPQEVEPPRWYEPIGPWIGPTIGALVTLGGGLLTGYIIGRRRKPSKILGPRGRPAERDI